MIDLTMRATVQGVDKLIQLEQELAKVEKHQKTASRAKGIAQSQAELTISNLDEENDLLKQQNAETGKTKIQMAKKRIEQKRLLDVRKADMILHEKAAPMIKRGIMTQTEALRVTKEQMETERRLANERKFANDQARQIDAEFKARKVEMKMLEQEELERKRALIIVEKSRRRELMQASIGMFVMGITMTQTLDTMGKMAGQGTVLEGVFKDMSQGVRLMLGPIQVVTSAMQFLNMENKKLMVTMLRFMGVFAGIYFLYKAFTSKSKELRFALAMISGVIMTLSALYAIQTGKIWSKIYAKIIELNISSLGAAAPLIAAALGVGAAMGLAAYASAPKGQNAPGYSRPVGETGLIYAHKGETISRIGQSQLDMASPMTVIFNIPENSIVDTGMVDYMTGQLEVISASGRGG